MFKTTILGEILDFLRQYLRMHLISLTIYTKTVEDLLLTCEETFQGWILTANLWVGKN